MHITTTKGKMDIKLLECKKGNIDNDRECTDWVEYWHNGELVHRSAHVTLKTSPSLFAEAASIT